MMRGALSVAALVMLFMHAACTRDEPGVPPAPPSSAKNAPAVAPPAPAADPASSDTASEPASASAADSAAAPAAERAPTVDFATPRTVVAGKNDGLSFTIDEATIEPRSPESVRLVLLVRMHNNQRQAANFSDENFRLLTRDAVMRANGGLDETVEAQSESKLERVEFVLPHGSVPRALQIEYGGETVELPLGFK